MENLRGYNWTEEWHIYIIDSIFSGVIKIGISNNLSNVIKKYGAIFEDFMDIFSCRTDNPESDLTKIYDKLRNGYICKTSFFKRVLDDAKRICPIIGGSPLKYTRFGNLRDIHREIPKIIPRPVQSLTPAKLSKIVSEICTQKFTNILDKYNSEMCRRICNAIYGCADLEKPYYNTNAITAYVNFKYVSDSFYDLRAIDDFGNKRDKDNFAKLEIATDLLDLHNFPLPFSSEYVTIAPDTALIRLRSEWLVKNKSRAQTLFGPKIFEKPSDILDGETCMEFTNDSNIILQKVFGISINAKYFDNYDECEYYHVMTYEISHKYHNILFSGEQTDIFPYYNASRAIETWKCISEEQ